MTVHAIVLKRTDSGESDRRLTLLTAEAGKITTVAKGARKAASRLAGVSDPLTCAVMDLAVGKRNSFVTQAQPLASFRGIRNDFERLTFALALLEAFAALIPSEQPQREAYDLLLASLSSLETHKKPMVALVWSLVALMSMEGFLPQFGACVVSNDAIPASDPLLSPTAGGVISEGSSGAFPDRFRVRAEVLYALQRLPELESPPPNLKRCEEVLIAFFPFLRYAAETALPATEAVVNEVRQGQASPPV